MDELFGKLKPILGQKIDSLWFAYQMEPSLRKEIEGILKVLAAKYLQETYEKNQILLEPPSEQKAFGEYHLGSVQYGNRELWPFGIRDNEWIQHSAILGRSGSGKTNISYLIIRNFLEAGKPFLIFDWKRNYRDLLTVFPEKEIHVYTIGRNTVPFYFNPLIPPKGTEPEIWLKKMIEIICHAYFLGEGVAALLQRAMDSIYENYGVYKYGSNLAEWPNFHDVRNWILCYKCKGREALWRDSTLRSLDALCFRGTGNALNIRQPSDIEPILKKNVVFELDALTNADKTFFTEAFLLWLHHYRMQEKDRETFKHATIIEEAHHILLRKKQEMTGKESITDLIFREIREFGEALIIIDQHPHLISKPAIGNTYATIVLNLKDGFDIETVSSSLLLKPNEKEYLGKLGVGTGIVKLQDRWFKPFLLKFPLFRIKKGVISDSLLIERMERHLAPRKNICSQGTNWGVIRSDSGAGITKQEIETTAPQQVMLKDVGAYPFSSVVDRYHRLRLNVHQGNKFRDELFAGGFINIHNISNGKGRIKLFILTEKGGDFIRNMGMGEGRTGFDRRGGIEHEYWKHRVAGHYRALGYEAILEYPLGDGKTVDVVAEKEGERIAIEVETGKSDMVMNIEKCAKADFGKIIVVATSDDARKKINNISPELLEKIEVRAGVDYPCL